MRSEQFGDAAAIGGGVDVQHPGAAQRFGRARGPARSCPVRRHRRSRRAPSRAAGRVRARSSLREVGGGASIYARAHTPTRDPTRRRCVPGQVPRDADRERSCRRDGRGLPAGAGSPSCTKSRSPTAARAPSTRCSPCGAAPAAAPRVTGPLGDPVEADVGDARRRHRDRRDGHASGLGLVGSRNDPLRATTRGTGELIATAAREGAKRVLVCVGGSATTDGGLGAVDALGWKLPVDTVVACDVETMFIAAARVFGPQKGATEAQVSLLERRLGRLAEQYLARTARRRHRYRGVGRRRRARRRPRRARRASRTGLRRRRRGRRARGRARGRHARRHRRRQARRVEPRRQGCRRCPRLGRRPRRRALRRDRRPGHRRRARRSCSGRHTNVLALTDRVWQAGEAFQRAALLVEEAAIEAARAALAQS